MNQVTIILTDSVKAHLDAEIASGRHKTASDYFCHLVDKEQKRRAKEHMEKLLLESLNSGPGEEVTPAFWEEMHQRIRDKAKMREAES